MWLALAKGRSDADGVEHVLHGLQALGQFADELRRRLSDDRVDGLHGMIDLCRHLRLTVARIPAADLDRTLADIHTLEKSLGDMQRRVSDLARLKHLVEG